MKYTFLRNTTFVLLAIFLVGNIFINNFFTNTAHAAGVGAIDFALPSGIDPWGTAFDSSGNVWVAVPGCDPSPDCSNPAPGKIEEFNPVTTAWMATYQLPAGYGQPLFLAFDATGNIWFPMFHTNSLGKFNPATQTFQQWTIPTANSGPWDLAIDHNGKIWFTEHYVNKIAAFDPATQTFTEVTTPANSQPYGITVDINNNIWFTENNPSVALIGEYTAGNQLLEYKIRTTLPGTSLTPHLITTDPNGNIWWTEGWVGMIGKLQISLAQPGTNNGVAEYAYPTTICPSCGTHTSGISVDKNGVVWFDDSLQSAFGSFPDSGTGQFSMYSIPSSGGHAHDGLHVDKNNIVWFTEEFANKLAEAGTNISPTPTPTVPPAQAMTLVAKDTFQRPNQSLWGTASDGNVWGAGASSNTAFSISSNSGVTTNPNAILAGILGTTIQDGQAVATGSSTFNGGDFGVALRYTNSNNWYKAYIDGSNLLIRRMLSGTNTVLNQTTFSAQAGISYSMRFQVSGNVLAAKAWATNGTEPVNWMITATDTALSIGNAGVQVAGSGTTTFTGFSAYTINNGTPTPTPVTGTIAQDTFQRANQSFWGTASDGHTWNGDANTNAVFSVASTSGKIANGNTSYNAILGASGTNEQVLFTGSMSSFSNTNLGAVVRFVDTNNWYKAYIEGNNIIIQKKINGTATTLATTAFSAKGGTSYSLRFQVTGTSLSAKAWITSGTEPTNWMATATDASLQSGFCGLRSLVQNTVTAFYTSFKATSI